MLLDLFKQNLSLAYWTQHKWIRGVAILIHMLDEVSSIISFGPTMYTFKLAKEVSTYHMSLIYLAPLVHLVTMGTLYLCI